MRHPSNLTHDGVRPREMALFGPLSFEASPPPPLHLILSDFNIIAAVSIWDIGIDQFEGNKYFHNFLIVLPFFLIVIYILMSMACLLAKVFHLIPTLLSN